MKSHVGRLEQLEREHAAWRGDAPAWCPHQPPAVFERACPAPCALPPCPCGRPRMELHVESHALPE
jgi:hypothetical protein